MKYALLVLLLVSLSFGSNLSNRLDNLIKEKKERKVVILKYNPFVFSKKKKTFTKAENLHFADIKREKVYRLVAIINNRAYIDNRWYKVGDKIDKYIVKSIDNETVLLSNSNKRVVLRFSDDKKILKIREK